MADSTYRPLETTPRAPSQVRQDSCRRGLEALGPDLACLVEEAAGAPVAGIRELTTLRSAVRHRGAWRIDLADGTICKARRLTNARQAREVAHLMGRAGRGFPRVLACRGDGLLLEWVGGPVLAEVDPIPETVLAQVGGLLAALHALDPGPGIAPRGPLSVEAMLARLEASADAVAAEGAVAPERLECALAMAAASRPRSVTIGVIHKDVCAENIVLSPERGPVLIDNASLAVGPRALGLARTWYRWPLTRSQRAALVAGSEPHRDLEDLLAHFPFWAVYVLVSSAAWRIRGRIPGVSVPSERLLALLAALEAGRTGEEHPFWTV